MEFKNRTVKFPNKCSMCLVENPGSIWTFRRQHYSSFSNGYQIISNTTEYSADVPICEKCADICSWNTQALEEQKNRIGSISSWAGFVCIFLVFYFLYRFTVGRYPSLYYVSGMIVMSFLLKYIVGWSARAIAWPFIKPSRTRLSLPGEIGRYGSIEFFNQKYQEEYEILNGREDDESFASELNAVLFRPRECPKCRNFDKDNKCTAISMHPAFSGESTEYCRKYTNVSLLDQISIDPKYALKRLRDRLLGFVFATNFILFAIGLVGGVAVLSSRLLSKINNFAALVGVLISLLVTGSLIYALIYKRSEAVRSIFSGVDLDDGFEDAAFFVKRSRNLKIFQAFMTLVVIVTIVFFVSKTR